MQWDVMDCVLTLNLLLFSPAKKDLDVTDDRMSQFKKKAKELRVLDPKTAQNLCKYHNVLPHARTPYEY